MEEKCPRHTLTGKTALFRDMIRCCYPVEFWEYNHNLELLSRVDDETELLMCFFKYSNAYHSLQEYVASGKSNPALLHCKEGLYWVADFYETGQESQSDPTPQEDPNATPYILLMGPFAMSNTPLTNIRRKFQSADHPLELHRKLLHTLDQIPLIPSAYLFQYAIMLHFVLTGRKITISNIQYPYETQRSINIFQAEEDSPAEEISRESTAAHHGVWDMEQQVMQAIRTGNPDYKQLLDQAALSSSGIQTSNMGSLRAGKDSVILLTGLCSRTAIAGNVPPEIAYDMCDQYVDMAESTETISELIHVKDLLLEDFVEKVRSYQNKSEFSRPVRICQDYIRLHVSENITLKKLADLCGYTEYYLSRKFKQETGISPGDYILHAKLDQAALLLKTTSYSVQDISDSLSFSSRSYFSTAFRKYTGLSPKAYRENPCENI